MTFEIIVFLIVYIICGLSPAIILCKLKKGEDIRNLGSGNAGTTNAIRVLGKFLGILVFILDILKTVIAYYVVWIIAFLFKQDFSIAIKSIFMVAAVIGHCYPIMYGFKGGKGVVTVLVASLMINFEIGIVAIITGIIVIAISRMVSLGSICGVLLYLIMTIVMNIEYTIPTLIIALLIIFKHRKNIKRIMKNEENKLF